MARTTKYSTEFETWWRAYPKRVGKRIAYKRWTDALVEISHEQELTLAESRKWLLERTQLFASSDKGRGEFVPYPATWLHQGRYDDDVDAWCDCDATPIAATTMDTTTARELRRSRIVREMQAAGEELNEQEIEKRLAGDERRTH